MSSAHQASANRSRMLRVMLIGLVAGMIGSFTGSMLTQHYSEEIDGYIMRCDGWVVELAPLSDCRIAVGADELLLIRNDQAYSGLWLVEGTSLHDLIYSPPFADTKVLRGPAIYEIDNGEAVTWELLSAADWQKCKPGLTMVMDMRTSWEIPCTAFPPF